MLRKIIALTLSILLAASIVFAQPAAELTVVDKAAHVEKVIYGSEQTGSLLERVTKLEKEVYGTETQEALIAKVDRIYSYTKDNSGTAPSLITRVNAIEWTLTHSQTQDSIKARIDAIEKLLNGAPAAGSIDSRVSKLGKLAFGNHEIVTETVECAKDTLVKIKLTNAIDTKTTRVGDVVNFQASEDVYINDLLIIAKGAPGKGKVTKVEQAKNFGRDAKLEIDFESIQALDGTTVDMFLGKKAQEETKSLGKAAGATFVGLVVLGPVGIVGGAFVQGEEAKIPAGTLMFIQTKDAVSLYGMKVK